MTTVTATEILSYCDGIDIFAAKDSIDGNYVAALVDGERAHPFYLAAGVSKGQLDDFLSGDLDLRDLILRAAGRQWFTVEANKPFGEPMHLEPCSQEQVVEKYLPEPGFTLDYSYSDDPALGYARERENCVFSFDLESPIRIDVLSELLDHLNTMVDHAYRAALSEIPASEKRKIDQTDASAMRVLVPAAQGSYRMVLEAVRPPDENGKSELTRGLEVIDHLFNCLDDLDEAVAVLGSRSRLTNSFSKFIATLNKQQTGVKYSWATPSFSSARRGVATKHTINTVTNALSQRVGTEPETVTFTGTLAKANLRTGGWGMSTKGRYISGMSSANATSLRNVVIGQQYEAVCRVIRNPQKTGLSRPKYYLKEMHEIGPA